MLVLNNTEHLLETQDMEHKLGNIGMVDRTQNTGMEQRTRAFALNMNPPLLAGNKIGKMKLHKKIHEILCYSSHCLSTYSFDRNNT